MNITVSVHTYNTYGGNSSISLVGQFLELGIPSFGEAIKELEIHVYFKGGVAKKSLESLFKQYHEFVEKLPSTKFYRKKSRFELNFLSELGGAEIVSGYGPAKHGLFNDSAEEIASAVSMLKPKIKKTDHFKYEEFILFIQNKISQLPKDEIEFGKLQETLETERNRKLDSMDEWEKLGIDWIDFHPKAREILDSSFFWNCTDDFSPNGNDTGADVLSFYQDWRKKNRKKAGITFFNSLMKEWDVRLPPNENDDFSRETYEQSIVGLAFAQLKVDSVCDLDINGLALESIDNARNRITEQHRDWDLYDERIRTFQLIENKLKQNA